MLLHKPCIIDYTIPKSNRELKPLFLVVIAWNDHTIPKSNRELKLLVVYYIGGFDYTIPKSNRELKPASVVQC